MVKRIRMTILFLAIYALLFWIGFRSGEIYNRMKSKIQIEKIIVKEKSHDKIFYVVEEKDYGAYKSTDFYEIPETHMFIRFFQSEKLRPLLKLRNMKIFDSEGNRIY